MDSIIAKYRNFIMFDFAVKVREYAYRKSIGQKGELPSLNNHITSDEIAEIKYILEQSEIRQSFLMDDFGIFIFITYFIKDDDGESLLLKKFELFRNTNDVKRAGLNIYKSDGWCTHVIVGLYISNIMIPMGVLPPTISYSKETNLYFQQKLYNKYQQFDKDDVFLLRIGTLIHDLGVLDGVEDHEKKGIKYVQLALVQLNITNDWLKDNRLNWTLEDLRISLEIFVEFHALPSKVFSEFGPLKIAELVSKIKKQANNSPFLKKWIESKFLSVLSIFFIGDLAAVREELITAYSLEKTTKSEDILFNLLAKETTFINTSNEEYGLYRLFDYVETDNIILIESILTNLKISKGDFLNRLGEIQSMSYSLSTIKTIKSISNRILFIDRLTRYAQSKNSHQCDWIELNFSPNVKQEWVESASDGYNTNWFDFFEKNAAVQTYITKLIIIFS